MKKYDDFINEEFTDVQERYARIVGNLFFDNGIQRTHINFDKNGLMMVTAYIPDNNKSMYTENIDKTIEILKFLKSINSIALDATEEYYANRNERVINYNFDFRNGNVPNYFKSLFGINKYKL